MDYYTRVISETLMVTPERARLVEGYLRLQFGTLDSLSRVDIQREYRRDISKTIDVDVNAAIRLADSYGL